MERKKEKRQQTNREKRRDNRFGLGGRGGKEIVTVNETKKNRKGQGADALGRCSVDLDDAVDLPDEPEAGEKADGSCNTRTTLRPKNQKKQLNTWKPT